MKKLILLLCLFMLPAIADAHSVTLGFTKSVDDSGAAGSGYTTWRLNGACPANVTTTSGFTQLNSTPFQGSTYTDSTVTIGSWCYVLTFSTGSATSVPSNTGAVNLLPQPPTSVVVTSAN